MNELINLWQELYYGILHRVPEIDLSVIPQNFRFTTHYDQKNNIYWIDSPDLPDFEATGKTLEELASHIKDTIYVYFDIPHYFAKRDHGLTKIDLPDPRTGDHKIITIGGRQQLENVLAGA